MKAVLLTSNSLRHKYIAAEVAKTLDLQLIITEPKSLKIKDTSHLEKEDADFMSAHLNMRDKNEAVFFGDYEEFPEQVPLLQVSHRSINSEEVFKIIKESCPEVLLLFGTSIIEDRLLEEYNGRIINLHLGLSPYYKGSATNLFPYFYNEPECIGATVHLASAEVDQGDILYQFRPEIFEDDTFHSIGNRVIYIAGKLFPRIVRGYQDGRLTPEKQNGRGRICRNKELTPSVLREIYLKFEKGMIPAYLHEKEKRDRKFLLVERGKD